MSAGEPVTKFLGIPVDGSAYTFGQKLKAKGFIKIKKNTHWRN